MTSPGTGTITRTVAITMIDVREVMWRIQSDLRILRAQHGMITDTREAELSEDLLQFVYQNFVEEIHFQFLRDGVVQPGSIAYALNRQWEGGESDSNGGLRYRDMRGLTFDISLTTTAGWQSLTPEQQMVFYQGLKTAWGPGGTRPVAGVWTQDRIYGSGSLGATRLVLR
jgi:hypothetical protein